MTDWNKPETEQDAQLTQDRRRFQALRSLREQEFRAHLEDIKRPAQRVGADNVECLEPEEKTTMERELKSTPAMPSVPATTKTDSMSSPITGQTAPVDPTKGNALMKKLFGSKLPIVPDPAPQTKPKSES